MSNRIITISREFGSGGRELGKRLAEQLGFNYFDREIITEIASKEETKRGYEKEVAILETTILYLKKAKENLSFKFLMF